MSRIARRQFIFVGVFLIVVLLFVTTFRMGVVRGESMMPTYQNGQVVLVRRHNWLSPRIKRDDVVLLRRGRDVLIKRVRYLPGDVITDWVVSQYIRLMDRTNGIGDYYEQQPGNTPSEGPRYSLPAGFIFVMGDNRGASEDSRQFGPVPLHDVLGIVVASPPPPAPVSDQDSSQEGSPLVPAIPPRRSPRFGTPQ